MAKIMSYSDVKTLNRQFSGKLEKFIESGIVVTGAYLAFVIVAMVVENYTATVGKYFDIVIPKNAKIIDKRIDLMGPDGSVAWLLETDSAIALLPRGFQELDYSVAYWTKYQEVLSALKHLFPGEFHQFGKARIFVGGDTDSGICYIGISQTGRRIIFYRLWI